MARGRATSIRARCFICWREKKMSRAGAEYTFEQGIRAAGSFRRHRAICERCWKRSATDRMRPKPIDLFCYRAKKYVGAYAAALGGLDALVFTGGIGERARRFASKFATAWNFWGFGSMARQRIERAGNFGRTDSRVNVRVIETNEDLMIVRHVIAVLGTQVRDGLRMPCSLLTHSFPPQLKPRSSRSQRKKQHRARRAALRRIAGQNASLLVRGELSRASGKSICSTIRCCGSR